MGWGGGSIAIMLGGHFSSGAHLAGKSHMYIINKALM